MEQTMSKVTKRELQPDDMNREESSSLSTSQKPLIQTLKEQMKALSKER